MRKISTLHLNQWTTNHKNRIKWWISFSSYEWRDIFLLHYLNYICLCPPGNNEALDYSSRMQPLQNRMQPLPHSLLKRYVFVLSLYHPPFDRFHSQDHITQMNNPILMGLPGVWYIVSGAGKEIARGCFKGIKSLNLGLSGLERETGYDSSLFCHPCHGVPISWPCTLVPLSVSLPPHFSLP